MTKKPKPPRPVESFGPELFALLIRAATTQVQFPLSYRRATRLRQRLHQLRESMRRSAHEHYELVSRVRITVRWPEETPVTKKGRTDVPIDGNVECEVTLQPNDSEFGDILERAGIDIGLSPSTQTTAGDGASAPPTTTPEAIDQMLGDEGTFESGLESILGDLDKGPRK